ncbi:hypothetical protein HpCOL18_06970 [Helicobacter pylori]
MLESTLKYCKEKAIDLLAGFVPKTYSMAQECNILGLYDDTFIITKQENLVGIISLQGLSYSNLMQKDLGAILILDKMFSTPLVKTFN